MNTVICPSSTQVLSKLWLPFGCLVLVQIVAKHNHFQLQVPWGKVLPCPGVPHCSSGDGSCPCSSGKQMSVKPGAKLILQCALLFQEHELFPSNCSSQEHREIAEQQQSLQWAALYWGNICPWPQECVDRCDLAGSPGWLISLLFLPFHLALLDSSTAEWYGPCAVSSIPPWCPQSTQHPRTSQVSSCNSMQERKEAYSTCTCAPLWASSAC